MVDRAGTVGGLEAALQPQLLPSDFSAPRIEWPDLLRNVQCPALLIIGDPEAGALVTQRAALSLEARVPQLRIAHIVGAGHNIRRDQFESYLQVLRPFLAEMSARA